MVREAQKMVSGRRKASEQTAQNKLCCFDCLSDRKLYFPEINRKET